MPDLDTGLFALALLLLAVIGAPLLVSDSEVADGTVRVQFDPALELGDRYQATAAAANDPELVHHVLL